jgi:hypothetical protein
MPSRLDLDETVYDQGRELASLGTRVDQIAEGQERIENKVDQVLDRLGKQDDRLTSLEDSRARGRRVLGWVGGIVTAVIVAAILAKLGLG